MNEEDKRQSRDKPITPTMWKSFTSMKVSSIPTRTFMTNPCTPHCLPSPVYVDATACTDEVKLSLLTGNCQTNVSCQLKPHVLLCACVSSMKHFVTVYFFSGLVWPKYLLETCVAQCAHSMMPSIPERTTGAIPFNTWDDQLRQSFEWQEKPTFRSYLKLGFFFLVV